MSKFNRLLFAEKKQKFSRSWTLNIWVIADRAQDQRGLFSEATKS